MTLIRIAVHTLIRRLENSVCPVPLYCAAVRLTFDFLYSSPGERLFVVELGACEDKRTDGQDAPCGLLAQPHANLI